MLKSAIIKNMNALVYGAGNIGRGFIGLLFSQAGYKVTFIDVNENIIKTLNENGSYPVKIVSNEESEETLVTGVKAINAIDEKEVINNISQADIMAIAVGVRQLPLITPSITGGLKKRFLNKAAPFNIIICENLLNADKYLAELIGKNLDTKEIKQLDEQVGFVETSIGRMVPIQTPEMQEGNILRVCTEKYAFLPVNKDALKGDISKIKGIVPFSNFEFFIQRKLFIHNMGHASLAYLGLLLGETFISDAASRADILFIVQNAMLESAMALHRKFNTELSGLTDIIDHIKDLINRFNNKALKDTCKRVGADIERKLESNDRFIGAINCCKEQGVIPIFISIGAAAAIFCLLKERELLQTQENAEVILKTIAALEKESGEASLILNMYNRIVKGNSLQEILRTALFISNKPEVI